MVKFKLSGPKSGDSGRRFGVSAVVAVALMLTVQIGPALHDAAHQHGAGETGECSLCVLCSHFIAEPASCLKLTSAQPVYLLGPETTTASIDSPWQIFPARGPPLLPV